MDHDRHPPHRHSHHYTVSNHRGVYKHSGIRASLVKGVSLRHNFSLSAILSMYGSHGVAASFIETIPGGFSLINITGVYGVK